VDEPAATAADPPRPKVRTPRAGWVGPLFKWELVRLARRGQDHRARFILAVVLMFVLTLFTIAWFPNTNLRDLFFGTSQVLPLQESAKFGDSFTLTFLFTQLAVLVLLTPAYAAGGIAEDKEKQTFIFLLVSDLTNREIVFGKFLGRLAFLLGVMVAGLPVLALTQVYGGVSLKFLLMGYLITGTTVTMLAAISAASAAATSTYRGALFRSYGLAALHVLVGCGLHPLLSPFGIIGLLYGIEADGPEAFLVVGLAYAGAQSAVAVASVLLAIRWVRKQRAMPIRRPEPLTRRVPRQRRWNDPGRNGDVKPAIEVGAVEVVLRPDDRVEPANGEATPAAKPLPTATRVAGDRPEPRFRRPAPPPTRRYGAHEPVYLNRPRVYADDPFYWKEKFTTGQKRTADDDSIRGVLIAVGVAVAIIVAFFALIAVMALIVSGFSGTGASAGEKLLVLAGVGGLFTYLLTVGAGAAGSVVRERQRSTIESLLTIPVPRSEILWPKWKVNIRRGWWWGVPGLVVLPLGLLASEAPLTALPAALFAAAAAPCTVSVALWLSTRCRTVTRAVLWLLPVVGGLTLAPVVAWSVGRPEWWHYAAAGMTLAALTAGGAAALFWFLALAEFEREGRT
jgi:ABC-type transport system involved in multi-copper enzyme maturation permease subunit